MTGKAKSFRLWKEITLALAIKGLVLAVIWSVWFSAPEEASLDDQKVASRIFSQQSLKEHDHDTFHGTR
jgi:hypothetical protein